MYLLINPLNVVCNCFSKLAMPLPVNRALKIDAQSTTVINFLRPSIAQ